MSVLDTLAKGASRLATDVQLSLKRARLEGERRLLQRQHRAALEELGERTYELVRAGEMPEGKLGPELAAVEVEADGDRGQGGRDRRPARRGGRTAPTGPADDARTRPSRWSATTGRARPPAGPAGTPPSGSSRRARDEPRPARPRRRLRARGSGCMLSRRVLTAARAGFEKEFLGVRAESDLQGHHSSETPGCHRCGLPLLADASFCPYCERWLDESGSSASGRAGAPRPGRRPPVASPAYPSGSCSRSGSCSSRPWRPRASCSRSSASRPRHTPWPGGGRAVGPPPRVVHPRRSDDEHLSGTLRGRRRGHRQLPLRRVRPADRRRPRRATGSSCCPTCPLCHHEEWRRA